jgi:sucrose-6-phosphate hydrolase SacC (GH32 family)
MSSIRIRANRRRFLRTASLGAAASFASAQTTPPVDTPGELVLNYHLMHPGGLSAPGDPNAVFYLDNVYHLHYILQHQFRGKRSFSFVHVTSPDMLHWTWHKTKLQPSFTGHGMFSGTGFLTKEGRPAVIYHGEGSGRNQIVIAKDKRLEEWERPYAVEPLTAGGKPAPIAHWDPDCFLIGDIYYALSGGKAPAVIKSVDLKNWRYVGDFLHRDFKDVVLGEDISCPNFFKLGSRWMMLCISHSLGCRYYLGDWDAKSERFVPAVHGRMNWRRDNQSLYDAFYRDFFAPESVLTPDGRRVMWAWCATLDRRIDRRTIQSLPRELSIGPDGGLRIRPLRELETLRYDPVVLQDLPIQPEASNTQGRYAVRRLSELPGDSVELKITVDRAQADRKRFGFQLFAGEKLEGLPIVFKPETGTVRVGGTEAPFSVSELPDGEDLSLRLFIDKYLVEIFINDRQALVSAHLDSGDRKGLNGYSFGDPVTVKKIEVWKLRSTNQGFIKAMQDRKWEPDSA